MIRRVLFSLFAFAVLFVWADDPGYYMVEDYYCATGPFITYSYSPLPDVLSALYPGVSFSPVMSGVYVGDDIGVSVITPNQYYDLLDEGYYVYVPFSSDPAYVSVSPSGPPSGSGGSSPGSGGSSPGSGGVGGFADGSAFSSLGDFSFGLGLAVGGLALAGVGAVSSFLVYRKVVASSKCI